MSVNGGYPGVPERDWDTRPALRPLEKLLRRASERTTFDVLVSLEPLPLFGWVDRAERTYEFVACFDLPGLWDGAPREDEVDRAPRAPPTAEAADANEDGLGGEA